MANPCTVKLENETYYPGQTVNGRVLCDFSSEEKVRAIRIRFKGRAKVQWTQGKTQYHKDETYFEMISDLLTCETTFPPGQYFYPFTFNLPFEIPPTLTQQDGNIKYFAEAVIDRPWFSDYKEKHAFTVHSYLDLNTIDSLKNPVNVTEVKKPFALFQEPGQIDFNVLLPATGFVPSQMVEFTAEVKNGSKIDVEAVQFQLIQGFVFYSRYNKKEVKTYKGDVLEITNSLIAPGRGNSWNLRIPLPTEAFTENMSFCQIINSFTELKGKLVLQGAHRDLKLKIPVTVGAVPLRF